MKKQIYTILGICLLLSLAVVAASAIDKGKSDKAIGGSVESPSYTTYHGNGIWSTTHILRKGDINQEKASKKPTVTGPTCYKLMGVQWAGTPNYVAQTQDLLDIAEISIGTWDEQTSFTLLGGGYVDETVTFEAVMDGKNSYSNGDYPLTGVIAVCRTWRDSYGNILEYDIMFDTDFTWGDATVTSGVMDLQNIATHEIGHGFGLSDLYLRPCTEQTMYGYSSEGDIEKRSLESGDILGIQTLYG